MNSNGNRKCLCIKQPFANLILSGEKKIEVRTWQIKYRGDLIITSAKIPINEKYNHLPAGKIICLVTLEKITKLKKYHLKQAQLIQTNYNKFYDKLFLQKNYAWYFTNIRPLKQIDIKNQQSIFELPKYLKDAVILL